MENTNVMWIKGKRFFSEDYIIEKMVDHAMSLRPGMNTVKQTEFEARTIVGYEILARHYLGDYSMRNKLQQAYVKRRYLNDYKGES